MGIGIGDIEFVVGAVAVVVVGGLAYKAVKAGGQVADVLATDLNPASDQNIVNRGVVGAWQWLTGDPTATPGGSLYDATHRQAAAIGSPVEGALNLPIAADVSSDAKIARWIIDNFSTFEASKWVSVGALWSGIGMPVGTGTAPTAQSGAGMELLPRKAASDEVARLAARYPAPIAEQDTSGFNWSGLWGV